MYRNTMEDFWAKVRKSDECWEWIGSKQRGYGTWSFDGLGILAHRFSYLTFVGPIPEGLQIDHLCRNRSCVRPDHLEPVTGTENQRRAAAARTICKKGLHPIAGGQCQECARTASRRRNRAFYAAHLETERERSRKRARAYYWRMKAAA